VKTVRIQVSDGTHKRAVAQAESLGVETANLYSTIVTEHFEDTPNVPSPIESALVPIGFSDRLDVARAFPGYPEGSIDLAQRLVNAALELPNVRVKLHKGAIAFDPSFVYLEALLRRGGRPGIRVSFYEGKRTQFEGAPEILRPGWPSYRRAVLKDVQDLETVLPFLRESYDRRLGRHQS
jgi:hypothetical protein